MRFWLATMLATTTALAVATCTSVEQPSTSSSGAGGASSSSSTTSTGAGFGGFPPPCTYPLCQASVRCGGPGDNAPCAGMGLSGNDYACLGQCCDDSSGEPAWKCWPKHVQGESCTVDSDCADGCCVEPDGGDGGICDPQCIPFDGGIHFHGDAGDAGDASDGAAQ